MLKLILVSLTLMPLLTSGCGYSVMRTSSLPLRTLFIGQAKNHTAEPGLQDLFVRTFTEESQKHGINTADSSGPGLNATITEYKLNTISIKSDLSAEYLINITADIHITYPDGTVREMKGLNSEYMETFSAPDSIQALHIQRELANEKAMRELSQRVISELIYGDAR